MNLTVPVVTGRLRRKSIAAEVVHCLTDLRLEHEDSGGLGGTASGTAKHNKRRGSLGGEPVRRPSLVSRWFKHISDAADAYKARTKGSHEYAEDATGAGAGSAGHPPKDTFETVTESQKIEQISATPLDPRLERKDSSQQCRAISTGGPGSGPSIGHSTSNASTGSAGSNNNNEDSLPNKNRAAANESDDNVENEEKEKVKRRSQFGGSSQDGGDDDDLQKPPVAGGDDDRSAGHHYRGRGQGCALTQQCSLVAPSEIHVSVSSALTAEPILTPTEKLRRLDQAIRKTLVEKQRVVCDMFRVPDEHFLAIADIAGQPEAPQKEPTDIILAAFAHIQSLTDVLNEHMRVNQGQEVAAVSGAGVCDECHRKASGKTTVVPAAELNGIVATSEVTTTGVPPIASVLDNDQVEITEDEDGYCEIDEVRAAAVLLESQLAEAEKLKKLAAEAAESTNNLDDSDGHNRSADSHIEVVNDNYDSTQNHLQPKLGVDLCGRNRLLHASALAPTIPCHLIASYVTGLNAQISQLLPKISERDLERETLRRENQHLRELLNAMHQERVLESQETTEAPVTDPETQPPQPQQTNKPQPPPAADLAAAPAATAAVPADTTICPNNSSSTSNNTVVNE